jgi:drug/metabolite transporter (DMT)-like permease
MSVKNTLRLLLLSMIWGSSFIFMRVLAPELGPVLTASLRTLIAGIFLIILFKFTGDRIYWRRDYKHLLIIGIVNSAIPFYLYSYAALHINASFSSIINSLSPLFGAIFSAIFIIEPLTVKKTVGLLLGIIGVGLISSLNVTGLGLTYYLSIGACIIAALCYGLSGVYIKLRASHIESKAIAAGSQFFAGIFLLPFAFINRPSFNLSLSLIGTIVVFAIVCSAFGYLLYFELIRNVGPTKTLTVTYLIPVTTILWGFIFLRELVSCLTIIGGFVILFGVYLVNSSTVSSKKIKADFNSS